MQSLVRACLVAAVVSTACSTSSVPETSDAQNAGSACPDAAIDLCPDDDAKTERGACGCGVADTDSDDNGVPDCFDTRFEVSYLNGLFLQAGSTSASKWLSVRNTGFQPLDLATLTISDVSTSGTSGPPMITPVVMTASGTLGVGHRTDDLEPSRRAALQVAGFIPEDIEANAHADIRLDFSIPDLGPNYVSFVVHIGKKRARMLVEVETQGEGIFEFARTSSL
jgi:hypothetical protein